jgi:hypothetical protein
MSKILIKPSTLKDLSQVYGVSVPTFKIMLEPYLPQLGTRTGRYFSITQVKLIFNLIDRPSDFTLKDLAKVYEVSVPTFKLWLEPFKEEIGEKKGHYFSVKQLKVIIKKLDLPSSLKSDEVGLSKLNKLCA